MPLGIIVDTALERRAKEGNPVRVGVLGAGFMAQGFLKALQTTVGMTLVGVCNRNMNRAREMLLEVMDSEAVACVDDVLGAELARAAGKTVVTSNWQAFTAWEAPEVILDVTGTIEFSSHVILSALRNRKHVVAMNAELDATLGPLLKRLADEQGVIFTNSDGDQPGVIINLYRYVKSIGFKPMVAGNIKGFHNVYGNPTTQAAFAEATKQNAYMVASFCDGSKVSFEQVVVANATGMRVPQRGMYGKTLKAPVEEAPSLYDLDTLMAKGPIVDYVVGLRPAAGVYVLGYNDDPVTKHYFKYYKQGDGPLYTFYTPYHLCHVEVPISCARAVLFNDVVCAAAGAPVADVLAVAKTDLEAGTELDAIGGYCCYGIAEDALVTRQQGLLPLGLAQGCKLVRPVAKDAVITWADVLVPAGRLCDQLWQQQNEVFGLPHPAIKFDEPPADAVAVNGAANDSSQKLSPVVVHKRTSSTPGSPDTPPQEEEEVPGAFPLPAAGFFMATSAKGSGVRITVPATAALS